LLGFSPKDVFKQPISRMIKKIEWDRVLNLEEKAWSELVSREIEITYPVRRLLNFYVMPITGVSDSSRGAVVILRDITGEREKQKRALDSERTQALMMLAAGVAHEIGNPLNSLHIHLQLMKRELANLPPDTASGCLAFVEVANREVDRLNLIITQFLKAIRPVSPQMTVCRVEEDLEGSISFMRPEIEDRGVLVDVKCRETLPKISADYDQLKQAFFNVMKNSLQAMSKGGFLSITLFVEGRYIGVSFKDTGAGISPENLSHLFEPFRSEKMEGTGLGLMIVQRIIREHGGRIELRSQPGVGTTFTIFLPLVEQRVRLLKAPRKTKTTRAKSRPDDSK